jgi:hypothetical protein
VAGAVLAHSAPAFSGEIRVWRHGGPGDGKDVKAALSKATPDIDRSIADSNGHRRFGKAY